MQSIKQFLKNLILNDDEIIITKKEYEQLKQTTVEPKKEKQTTLTNINNTKLTKPRTQKGTKIIKGEYIQHGVIKKYAHGRYSFYVYQNGTQKVKYGALEELEKYYDEFKKSNYDISKFDEICKQPQKKNTNPSRYIYELPNGAYILRLTINNKMVSFGTYSSVELANEVKDYLLWVKNPLEYEPSKLKPARKNKFYTDEYYLTMVPIMEGNHEYQMHLKERKQ